MSQDFTRVLIKDDRLCVTDKLSYAVEKGGQNMTPQVYPAVSTSPSSVSFNVNCPSEVTVLDRRVLWQSQVQLQIIFPAGSVPVGQFPINYGLTDALAPFPLHSLTTVQSATINNNTVSLNTRDVLPALMRFTDKRSIMQYNGMCPNMYDTYGRYSDAVGSINNPLGGYTNVGDNYLVPRGAFPLVSIVNSAGGPMAVSNGTAQTLLITFYSSEPLLISPFVWVNPESNNQGIYGITNMNFVFNIGDCSRVWRSSNPWMNQAQLSVVQFEKTQLLFNQLTPHPSDLMPSRNIVPYMTMPRFITNYSSALSSIVSLTTAGTYLYSLGDGTLINSSNIMLNMIPDKVIIFVRKQQGLQKPTDTDSFAVINKISIQFNNQSGILSTATMQDLFRYSVESGSNQNWEEFSGISNTPNSLSPGLGQNPIPTSGSLLVLEFGRHIQIQDDWYAPGSLGNFNFQFNINVQDQLNLPGSTPNTNWEVVLITVNSGLFASERGVSSTYTGILTRSDVLDVSTQDVYSKSDVKRMVGGGWLDSLKSVAGKVLPIAKMLAPVAKAGLSLIPNPAAQMAAKGIGALGYGRSGGGSSGGGRSGGRHKLDVKLLD